MLRSLLANLRLNDWPFGSTSRVNIVLICEGDLLSRDNFSPYKRPGAYISETTTSHAHHAFDRMGHHEEISLYFANPRLELACKNIRFSSLFAAGDVPREASPAVKSVASHAGVYRGHVKFCQQNSAMLIVLREN